MSAAFAFVALDGGHNSVVGCSGGVYCIFGMHLAEIVLNWSLEHRGLLNHWTRLLIMMVVLGADGWDNVLASYVEGQARAWGGGVRGGV